METPRRLSLGEDEFYETLDRRDPGLTAHLKRFLMKAEDLGVTADWQRALNLKHAFPGENPLNLGTIDKDGFLETGPASWWNRADIGRPYNQKLASLIGGFVRDVKGGQQIAVRTTTEKMPRLSEFLPAHEQEWLDSISEYIQAAFKKRRSDNEDD